MERAEADAAEQQRVRGVGFRQCALRRYRGETFEPRSQCVDPGEINLRQPPARQSSGANPGRKFPNRREGDVRLIRRQWSNRSSRKSRRTWRRHAEARQPRIEAGRRRHRIVETELPTRDRRSDLPFEVLNHLDAFGRGIGDPYNALGAFDVRNRDHFTFLRFLGAAMEPKDGANEKAPQRASRSVERKGGDNRGVRRKFQAAKAKTRSAP